MKDLKQLICEFKKDSFIFKQGDEGDCMYVIQEGAVLIKREIAGKQKELEVLRKGQFFGEISVIIDKPRSASAYVLEDSKLLKVTKDDLELIFNNRSDIAKKLFIGLSERLSRANKQIDLLLTADPSKRILGGLMLHCSMYIAYRVGNTLKLNITVDEFAFELGVEPKEVENLMKDLKTEKIAEIKDDSIVIKDLKKLKHYFEYFKKF